MSNNDNIRVRAQQDMQRAVEIQNAARQEIFDASELIGTLKVTEGDERRIDAQKKLQAAAEKQKEASAIVFDASEMLGTVRFPDTQPVPVVKKPEIAAAEPIVIEVTEPTEGWEKIDKGLIWKGPNINPAGSGVLRFAFRIEKEGVYRLRIKSFNQNDNQPTDQANDVWVRFKTGTDVSNGQQSGGNWFKVFRVGAPRNAWSWQTVAEIGDIKSGGVRRKFTAGEHVIELSGRSTNFIIQRFALTEGDLQPAQLEALPVSDTDSPDEQTPVEKGSIAGLLGVNDLLVGHFDVAPDLDDLHAMAAFDSLCRKFKISPLVVIGTCGKNKATAYRSSPKGSGQSSDTRTRRKIANSLASLAWDDYLDANYDNKTTQVAATKRWQATLQNGGHVWVCEGGPMDFTTNILQRLRQLGLSDEQLKTHVHVVQHADPGFNRNETASMDTIQKYSDYIRIANGNHLNATADLESGLDAEFVNWARAESAIWKEAVSVFAAKIDYSDVVEALHVLGVGKDKVGNITEFRRFV